MSDADLTLARQHTQQLFEAQAVAGTVFFDQLDGERQGRSASGRTQLGRTAERQFVVQLIRLLPFHHSRPSKKRRMRRIMSLSAAVSWRCSR